ncbi:hypothetical protein LCGC14_1904900, partial [marine sediment metagenome]
EHSPDEVFPRICSILHEIITGKKVDDSERGNDSSSGASTEKPEDETPTASTSTKEIERALSQ